MGELILNYKDYSLTEEQYHELILYIKNNNRGEIIKINEVETDTKTFPPLYSFLELEIDFSNIKSEDDKIFIKRLEDLLLSFKRIKKLSKE